MRKCLLPLALLLVATLATTPSPSPADPLPVKKVAVKSPDDWKEDSVCRMVFFAVLEGLYTDGVSSEAVDRVVGRKTKGGPADLKQTFVIQCPLCHPVYEAFCVYQQRPAFTGGKRDTFGKGLDTGLEERLKSPGLVTRQRGLQVLVQRWVGTRLAQMRLSAKEKVEWSRRLEERSQQGKNLLTQLRRDDAWYKGWSGYAGCPSCDGSTAACKRLDAPGKK